MAFQRWLLSFVIVFILGAGMAQTAQADFSEATKSSTKPFCAAGSFFDPRQGGECWSCPQGTNRTVFPVTGGNACERPAWSGWSKATFRGKAKTSKPRGAFFDPRKGGEWWKCPSSRPRRTLYAVTDSRACATRNILGEKLAPAQFLGKVNNPKPRDAFYDPRGGGEYWSCPAGFNRTVFPVTAGNACEQVHGATATSARYVSKFGCPRGTFFDPRAGGECWSCPASHPHRTVNPVTGGRACSRTFGEIFAVDPSGICRQAIAAIHDGGAAIEKFQETINRLTAPVTDPIVNTLNKAIPDIQSPKALRDMLAKLPLGDPQFQQIMTELTRIANQEPEKLAAVVMNPNVVCGGNVRRIQDALVAAGLRPDFRIKRASLFDGFPIGRAYASGADTRQVLYAVTGSASMISNKGAIGGGLSVAVAIVTDLHGLTRVYFSVGPTLAAVKTKVTAAAFEVHREFGVMIFPHSRMADFEGIADLGLELGFGVPKFNDLMSRFRGPLGRLDCIKDNLDKIPAAKRKNCKWDVDIGVDVSFNPAIFSNPAGHIPGIGLSFSPHRDSGQLTLKSPPEVSFTGDFSFPLY